MDKELQFAADTADMEDLFAEGCCCTQAVLRLFLDRQDRENPELVEAAAGLCGGLFTGNICGAISGAALAMSMTDRRYARVAVPELIQWFENEYGSVMCSVLSGENGVNRPTFCHAAVTATYGKMIELMEKHGFLPEALQ